MNYTIGLDLGGTNIKGLAVTSSGSVLTERISATLSDGGNSWRGNVRDVLSGLEKTVRHKALYVGLAAPGLPSSDQRSIAFMPGRLPGLEGLDWHKYLRTNKPVPVLNDAQAALLGEVWRGAARRSRNAVLLTLGTGVGGAAIVDGRLLRGHLGRAGHLGHISLDPNGLPDVTGTPGSLEDAIGECSVLKRTEGRFESSKDLVAAANRGDADAKRIWSDSIRALAAGIASIINVLDPEVVIIGGGIAKSGSSMFKPLRKFLSRFEWQPGGSRVRIVAAKLGDRAGAFGAAYNSIRLNEEGSVDL